LTGDGICGVAIYWTLLTHQSKTVSLGITL
jgi:hypothetical protein